MFVRGRFQGSCYCGNLKFCMRIYTYEYNRNILELEFHEVSHNLLTSDLS